MDPLQIRSFSTKTNDKITNESNSLPKLDFSIQSKFNTELSDDQKYIYQTLSNNSTKDTKYLSADEKFFNDFQYEYNSLANHEINSKQTKVSDKLIESRQKSEESNHQESTINSKPELFDCNFNINVFDPDIQFESFKENDPFCDSLFCGDLKLIETESFNETKSSNETKEFISNKEKIEEIHIPIEGIYKKNSEEEKFQVENFKNNSQTSIDNATYLNDIEKKCIFTQKSGHLEKILEIDKEISEDDELLIEDKSNKIEIEKKCEQTKYNQDNQMRSSEFVSVIEENKKFNNNFEFNEALKNHLSDDEQTHEILNGFEQSGKKNFELDKIAKWKIENDTKIQEKDKNELKLKKDLKEQAIKEKEVWYSAYKSELKMKMDNNRIIERNLINEFKEKETSKCWMRVVEMCDSGPGYSSHQKDVSRLKSVLLNLKDSTKSFETIE